MVRAMRVKKQNRISGVIYAAALLILVSSLISSTGATSMQYSVQNWDEAPPVNEESKAPVPLDLWQVSPLVLAAVTLAMISPVMVLPAEIILGGIGLVALNFHRVEVKTVLDHELRNGIYRHVLDNPGVCFTDIEKGLDVNRGTLDYHLKVLRREHRIAVLTKNGRSFYFENSGRYTREEMEMLAILRNDTEFTICEYLLDSPGASRNEIVSLIKTTYSTVSWHMKRLTDSGLVCSTKDGRIVSYHLSGPAKRIVEDISGSRCV